MNPYQADNIRTLEGLKKLVDQEKTISARTVIRGNIKRLKGVEKIDGDFGIADSNLESLGSLREISGDFWLSFHTTVPCLTDLGDLEKVKGNVSLHGLNITNLGVLREVGGDLNLRSTQIQDLGKIEYVGGFLYLPKRLQSVSDLSSIKIDKGIRYYNDKVGRFDKLYQLHSKYTESLLPTPFWEHQYVYSVKDLKLANPEQKRFYEYFKRNFLNEKYIDVEGNTNCPFILYFDLIKDYEIHKDSKKLQKQMEVLGSHYGATKRYADEAIIKLLKDERNYEAIWELKKTGTQNIGFNEIYIHQKKIKKRLMDGEMILRLAATSALGDYDATHSFLTPIGQNNIKSIQAIAECNLEEFENTNGKQFFDIFLKRKISAKGELVFFNDYSLEKKHSELYDREFYKQFFVDEKDFEKYKSSSDKYFVFRAMRNQLWKIIEKAESAYCQSVILQDGRLLRSNNSDFDDVFSITEVDSIDLINFINNFLDALPSTEREVFLDKFGGSSDEKTLSYQEIGLRHNITAQKVSSLATKTTKAIKRLLGETYDIISKKIYDSCLESVCPLTSQFLVYLTNNDYRVFLYLPAFYIRLIGLLSPEIPSLPEFKDKNTNLGKDAVKMSEQIKVLLKNSSLPVALVEVFDQVAQFNYLNNNSAIVFFEAIQSPKFNLIKGGKPNELYIELSLD